MNYLPFSSSHSEGGGGGGSILQGASGGEQGEGDGTSLMGDLKESTTLTKKQVCRANIYHRTDRSFVMECFFHSASMALQYASV